MSKPKLLIIEDCAITRKMLAAYLSGDYEVAEAERAEEGLLRAKNETFDLVIVDIGLPSMDGFAFCSKLRETDAEIPIIIFSGRTDVEDKLFGFSLGACDYILKPADPRELKMRIQSQLKRRAMPDKTLSFGPMHFNSAKQSVAVEIDGRQEDLTISPLEYRLLHFFVTHGDQVLTREQLRSSVWGEGRFVNDRSVDAVISKLRAKLGPYSSSLQSVRGSGYRFRRPERKSA